MKRHRQRRRRLIGGWLSVAAGVFLLLVGVNIRQSTAVDQHFSRACLDNSWTLDVGRYYTSLLIPARNLFYARLLGRTPLFLQQPVPLGFGSSGGFGRGCFIYIIDR